ncbi:MAG: T9SS type A sorting domain-containing protein [Bacteroidota bacterium]
MNIQIYNSQGQTIAAKDIAANGLSYAQVATLKSGVYWMRLTDVNTQKTCVNQLLIK